MQPEADVISVTVHDEDPDSEIPLTLFDVTHPGLAAVKVDTFWQPTSQPDLRETQRERLRKPCNQNEFCHTDHDLFAYSEHMDL